MNYTNSCDFAVGHCPTQASNCRKRPWYCKFIKPLVSFMVSVLLALSMSHLSEKYSSNKTFEVIKADLGTLKHNLNLLGNEVRTLTLSRDDFESKLKEASCTIPKLSEAILLLRNEVSEGIDTRTKKLLEVVSTNNLRQLIKTELQTYDADKTGRADYALESSGGSILSTRDTQTYVAGAPVLKLFGVPLCHQNNNPRSIIQTSVLPGECWAFKGSKGSVVIQLLGQVRITGASLEHISPMISPTGETSTAPREFSIWGLRDVEDRNGCLIGEFVYDNSGPPVQYFDVECESNSSYEMIELKVHSNSGNHDYTCIYRIRIHGILTSKPGITN